MKAEKVSTVLILAILAISLFFIVSLFSNLAADNSDKGVSKWIDVLLIWTCILLLISCFATLWLELAYAISDKRTGKKSIIFIGSLAAVFLFSFLLSDSEMPQFKGVEKFIDNGILTPAISHCIETCLFTAYILMTIAIIGVVYSYVYQLFK